jgi:type II secretory pathway component GspD/PulD (secretin)
LRMIQMPADAVKEAFEPNENVSSGLLFRQGHEIAGRLLTIAQERKDAKLLIAPQMLLNNNSDGTISIIREEFFIHHYEPNENEPGKLAPQLKPLDVGWKFKIFAEIPGDGEQVHIKLAARRQKSDFKTLQYRPGYDYQVPSPPEIFTTDFIAKNGEPVVIGRLIGDETAYCLIVTPSLILPERQPEPLLGKKLPEPDNIQNIDSLRQAEGKRILVCFWDSQQRPSRNLVGELAKRGKELASKNIAVMLIDTSGVEPAKLKEWLDNRNIPFTCGSIKYNVKDVLIRWGVRAQPWLILTDENGIVRAEGLSLEQLDEKLQETNEPTAARTRIVHFPDDHAVGNLKVRDARPDVDWDRGYLSLPGWALLGPAQGDVNIPAGEDLRLEVSGNVTDFSFLSDLKPNDLQVLLLSDKKISDDDLVYLKGLTGLLALHLGSTPIEDKGLAHLAPLTSLKELTLFNTKVSDAGLEHLSTLKSLKRLNLFITQVRGPGLQYLQNLTLLVSLDLAATPITDVSLVHVAKITWLKELELQDTAITDRGLAHLKSLRSLEMLILGNADLRQGYSPITDDGLVYLKELDSLKDLYLLRTRVTDAGLAHLSNLKTLEALDLTETRITGEGLAYLKDLPALIHLNLEKTGVTEVGLKYLKEMTNLRVLSLDGESFYEKDLKDLEKALPDCKVTVRTAYSANSVPEVPVLSKSAVPSAEDKSIVKVDLSVVEVPSDSQVERETTKETRNMLGGKITIPDSPAVADLLRKAAGATAAVKDESAGGKRVTQKEFKTLSDLLVSRGYVKILMNPSLEVVDGQTAQIKTDQSSFDVTVESVKDDIIDLTVQAELTSQIAPANEGKKPMISRRSFASFVSINSGQSQIIGGTIQPAAHPDTEGNAKVPQTPAGEILCIVTASIIAPPADTKPQEKASVNKNQVFPECIQLKYYRASDAAQVVRPLLGKAGSVSFDQKTNIIIIIDKIENLKRIEKIITALEVSRTAQPGETKQQDKATADKEYEIIQLRHIDANEAAERIIKVLSQMPEKEFRPSVRVQPLENTGQIIIFGRKDLREIVKKLIDELDITEGHFVTQVFQLKYANPDLIKEKIEGSYKYPANEPQEAVRVIALPKTKQVTVIASPENLSRIAEQIAEWDTFDILKPRIIELQNSDPAQMVGLLTTLFAEEGGDEVNIRDVILSENIAGPLSSHFIFEDVPETSKIIVMSNIPEAYDAVGQLIFELDKQKMATKDVKQVREWIARLIKEGRLGVPKTINEVEHSEKLFKLGKALLTYANNHDGKYPDSIAQVKQYLKADEFVWAQQNVTYYGKGRTVDDPPDIHLARDNRQAVATKGTNILFNDGRVEFIKPGRQKDRSITKDKIQIDTKILTVSDEFMKYIGLDPNSVASSEGWSEYLVDSTDDSASFVIDQLHEKLLLRNVAARMRTHKDVQMLHPPGMLAKSGMKYEMHITDSEPYNVLVGPPDSNVFFVEPESKSKGKKPGTAIRLNPTLTPDGKNIELDFEWEYRRLRSIKEHTGLDGNVQKVPQIGIDRIKTPCTIPIGKTLLIAGKKIAVQKKKEPKKFGLADLPLIGGLFYRPPKAEETKNLLIMVTPTTDIKALPVPPLTDPNDPLVKKLEGKFERADKQK